MRGRGQALDLRQRLAEDALGTGVAVDDLAVGIAQHDAFGQGPDHRAEPCLAGVQRGFGLLALGDVGAHAAIAGEHMPWASSTGSPLMLNTSTRPSLCWCSYSKLRKVSCRSSCARCCIQAARLRGWCRFPSGFCRDSR
jgi:hypothetical protein